MRAPSGDRRGFTLVEVTVVAMVVSLLTAIAVPNLQRALLKARAAELASELNVVRVAVINYQADNHAWPAETGKGKVPDGLAPYLPAGFTFTTADYTLDYDNLGKKKSALVGVTVVTADEELGLMMVDMLGGNAWTNGKKKFTWVIQWRG